MSTHREVTRTIKYKNVEAVKHDIRALKSFGFNGTQIAKKLGRSQQSVNLLISTMKDEGSLKDISDVEVSEVVNWFHQNM